MNIQEFRSAVQTKGAVIAQKVVAVENAKVAYDNAIKALDSATNDLDMSVNEYVDTQGNKTIEGLNAMKDAFMETVDTFNFKLDYRHDNFKMACEKANVNYGNVVNKCCNPLWVFLEIRSN